MKCKKGKILDNCDKWVFIDKYGFCIASIVRVTIDNRSLEDGVFKFVEKNKRYERIVVDKTNIYGLVNDVFLSDLATRKNAYYANMYEPFSSEKAIEFKAKSIVFYLRISYYTDFLKNNKSSVEEKIELNSISDFDKYECWIPDNLNNNCCVPVDLSTLKEGDEIYLMGKGKVKVSKIYSFPNKDNIICDVNNFNNESFSVSFDSQSLYYLPYEETKTLLDEIDDAFNELALLPYVVFSNGVYNIYWKPVNEASRYIVSVYKYIKNDKENICYHLTDFDIDRNTFYLALDKLAGSGFIFKVFAEDRNGKIIAKSRGVTIGRPKYLKD